MPTENTTTEDSLRGAVSQAPATTDLDASFTCDLDGARLEVHGRNTVGDTTYEVRKCSSNPAHVKQIPL